MIATRLALGIYIRTRVGKWSRISYEVKLIIGLAISARLEKFEI